MKTYEEFNIKNIFKRNKDFEPIDMSKYDNKIDPLGEEDWEDDESDVFIKKIKSLKINFSRYIITGQLHKLYFNVIENNQHDNYYNMLPKINNFHISIDHENECFLKLENSFGEKKVFRISIDNKRFFLNIVFRYFTKLKINIRKEIDFLSILQSYDKKPDPVYKINKNKHISTLKEIEIIETNIRGLW